jgi:hypothetical protein
MINEDHVLEPVGTLARVLQRQRRLVVRRFHRRVLGTQSLQHRRIGQVHGALCARERLEVTLRGDSIQHRYISGAHDLVQSHSELLAIAAGGTNHARQPYVLGVGREYLKRQGGRSLLA